MFNEIFEPARGRLDRDPAGAVQPQPDVAVAPGGAVLQVAAGVFGVHTQFDRRVLEEQGARLDQDGQQKQEYQDLRDRECDRSCDGMSEAAEGTV